MENETMTNHLDETTKLPEDFDWKIYLIKNVDLILAGINNEKDAVQHYLEYGVHEHRIYYEDNKADHFIYCGGKCGSTTLYSTLIKQYFKCSKLHSNEEYMSNKKASIYDIISQRKKTNEKIYFIDTYRNPIERKISCFFSLLNNEYYSLPMSDLFKKFNKEYIEIEFNIIIHFEKGNVDNIRYLIQKLSENIKIDEFHENYIKLNNIGNDNLNILCSLFDKNKESLGIVSYKKNFLNQNEYYHSIDELFRHFNISETFTAFDFDKKYGLYQHENMVFIKLRFCDINEWGKILSGILGKEITTFPDNLTENKEYFDLYTEFKSQYKVPRSFIKELLKDEHFNAYNTVDERRKYIKYWMDRSY